MIHESKPLCEIPLIHSLGGTIQLQGAALPLQPHALQVHPLPRRAQSNLLAPSAHCRVTPRHPASLHTHPLIQQAKGHQPRCTHARNVQQPSNYLVEKAEEGGSTMG